MENTIQVLPDVVANQIAAGEVVQRPASVVKELLENAVDAGAQVIQLIVKDAGKTLIQVIDDGKGMNEYDARLCFERHATSKLRKAEDLFQLHTKGFRGEALASIAAIASVELKTKQAGEDLGYSILNEACEIRHAEPVTCPKGTSISVKNLFFNVPARRNFLKSNQAEFTHIQEEFIRVALAHPDIQFSLHHNGTEHYLLHKGGLRQRIVALFGNPYNERLVPVHTDTTIVEVSGFLVKPQYAKRSRGEQYFFVNDRFIKNSYLNHAVSKAFEGLLPYESYPGYFLFLKIDPQAIDVNIHPTKTEIKFEDEKSVYNILRSAVKMSLGQYNISPSLDFEQEVGFEIPVFPKDKTPSEPKIQVNPFYNPFEVEKQKPTSQGGIKPSNLNRHANQQHWESLYEIAANPVVEQNAELSAKSVEVQEENIPCFQYQQKYIVTALRSGLLVIDQVSAHQRILFERALKSMEQLSVGAQQLLFPVTMEFNASEYHLLKEAEPLLSEAGFSLSDMGKNVYALSGVPELLNGQDPEVFIRGFITSFGSVVDQQQNDLKERLAIQLSVSASVRSGQVLKADEMQQMIRDLFSCNQPNSSPTGKSTLVNIPLEELMRRFGG